MSLARDVFVAQKAQLKVEEEQRIFELEQASRQAQEDAELQIAAINAQQKAVRTESLNAEVDARVAQVNALTNSINQRQQADNIRFGAAQDRIAAEVEGLTQEGSLRQQAGRQQRQIGEASRQLGQNAGQAVAQRAASGGSSSQTSASIRGDFTSLAQERGNVNRETSGAISRNEAQTDYQRRLMRINEGLAFNQAAGLELQADVNQELQEEVANRNATIASSDRINSIVSSSRARSAIEESADQAQANYADAIRTTRRQTRETISQARRTLL